jgi:thiol-disulfide isomerase/thioredoxin
MQNQLNLTILVALGLLAALTLARADVSTSGPFDLSDYEGRVVIVDFWASWCVPCRRSFPWLNAMQEKYADDGLVVIGVNVDREPEDAAEFLRDYPASFRITYDTRGSLAKEFGVQGMPSSFVIGRDGTVKNEHLGFKVKRQDEYEAAILAALHQNTGE